METINQQKKSLGNGIKSYFGNTSYFLCSCIRNKHFVPWKSRKRHISLAVAGEVSSGKSFLLRDMLDSLNAFGVTNFFPLKKRTGEVYQVFKSFDPDENGGTGGTPLYAYRMDKHYGGCAPEMDGMELDFLNIPGEAFFQADMEKGKPISSLRAYELLQQRLFQSGRFRVRLYKNGATYLKVVEPIKLTDAYKDGKENPTFSGANYKMAYRNCSEYYGYLASQDYEECKALGYPKTINGQTLLKNFFDYDTDSVMLALSDFIDRHGANLGFDATTFKAGDYDRSFAFIHYCACATDVVVCDRVYIPQNSGNNSNSSAFDFHQFCQDLHSLNIFSKNTSQNFYLAFRNVDFFMKAKETNFKDLSKDLNTILKKADANALRNAVYSLFHYSIMTLFYGDQGISPDDFLYQIFGGTDEFREKNEAQLKSVIRDIPGDYVDTTGNSGTVNGCINGEEHIKNRIGLPGGAQGFLALFGKLAPGIRIYPHIYFTCTPMTLNGDIYVNSPTNNEFVHLPSGKKLRDSDSRACFGAYQLCMDILMKHNIGEFDCGRLLRQIQGSSKE